MVDNEQYDAQEEADGAHGDVGDSQKGVLATHPGNCAQDHPLPALKAAHWVVWEVSGSRTILGSYWVWVRILKPLMAPTVFDSYFFLAKESLNSG